ncbi:MAG: type II and III secretion system protein, partial [bacterium]|nr:type II and III secretion system protein [bacterium]
IIIIGKPDKRAKVKDILAIVDMAPPEVLIEVQFVDMTAGASGNFNINWQISQGKTGLDINTNLGNSTVNYGTIVQSSLKATLDMLVTENKARVLTSPKIAALNNQTASIILGETYSYKIVKTREEAVPNTNPTQYRTITDVTWETVPVGISLTVIPHVHPDGMVTTQIYPIVSAVTGQTSQDAPPSVVIRTAQTTIRVRDGETIVIGGLARRNSNKVEYKVPLLGDLPLVGNLFKSRTQDQQDSELVIFLTPHILPY